MASNLNRRQFLGQTAATGAAVGIAMRGATSLAASSPSNKVVVGVMGLSRGRALTSTFAKLKGVEVKYACDVDIDRAAKELPDGKTIAHGYLTLAMIPALTGNFVDVKNLARAINFGVNKVRFYSPVPAGVRVRARATVLKAQLRGGALLLTSEIRIEVEDVRKPACVAETLGMYFFAD